jgi:hypothetical protein
MVITKKQEVGETIYREYTPKIMDRMREALETEANMIKEDYPQFIWKFPSLKTQLDEFWFVMYWRGED